MICDECGNTMIADKGYYACMGCGYCSEEVVFASAENKYNEDNYRKQHRKEIVKDEDAKRVRVYLYNDIYDELKDFLKGKNVRQIRFVSEAIADAMLKEEDNE